MSTADLIWLVWLAIVVVTFAALEAWGLRHKGGTLSERIRAWFGIQPRRPWRSGAVVAFIGVLSWFLLHITVGL